MEFNKCYACFHDLPADQDVCPHCGYDNRLRPEEQPPCALRCGTILAGRYFLGRIIDRTDFEIVYIAYDLAQEKRVCVRELFPGSLAMRTASESRKVGWSERRAEECSKAYDNYISETGKAKKLQGLEHVAGICDVFRENNTAYCVTDYFEGVSLKNCVYGRSQPFDDKSCAELFLPLAEELEKVHAAGMLHLGIHAKSLLVTPEGKPVLLNLAEGKDPKGRADEAGLIPAMDCFIPLEQFSSKGEVGPWTDVYALCAAMYFCLTGKYPPSSLGRLGGEKLEVNTLSPAMRGILEKGLALQPQDRYRSMAELAEALRGGGTSSAREENAPREERRRSEKEQPGDGNSADPKPKEHKKPALWPKLLGAAALLAAAVIVWSAYGKGGDKTTEGTVTATPVPTATAKPAATAKPTAKPAATPAPTAKPTAKPAPTAKPTATPAATPAAADAARKVEEQIAALTEITADSASAVRAARAAYDALSADAKKAVGNLSMLTAAEGTLQKLLDEQALAEIKRLYSNGDYEGTIEYAEAYFADRDLKTFSDDFFDYTVWAYTLAAQQYEYDSEYEKAQKLLEKGSALYAETAYGSKAREALDHLNEKIRSNEPYNGKIMRATANSGYGELEIKNGGSNALIKLESISEPDTYYLEFYVRENETVTVNVRDGRYRLKYATGKTWYSEKELFGSGTAYTKADTVVSFETTYSGSYVNYERNEITLYKVQNGNLTTSPISRDDF